MSHAFNENGSMFNNCINYNCLEFNLELTSPSEMDKQLLQLVLSKNGQVSRICLWSEKKYKQKVPFLNNCEICTMGKCCRVSTI